MDLVIGMNQLFVSFQQIGIFKLQGSTANVFFENCMCSTSTNENSAFFDFMHSDKLVCLGVYFN